MQYHHDRGAVSQRPFHGLDTYIYCSCLVTLFSRNPSGVSDTSMSTWQNWQKTTKSTCFISTTTMEMTKYFHISRQAIYMSTQFYNISNIVLVVVVLVAIKSATIVDFKTMLKKCRKNIENLYTVSTCRFVWISHISVSTRHFSDIFEISISTPYLYNFLLLSTMHYFHGFV